MNLKEIGILLIGLFMGSSLLIAYKYYVARGGVFQISRVLVFKYLLRFLLLIALLMLCFYTISSKQINNKESSKSGTTLFVISSKSSRLTWNSMVKKVTEMPDIGIYCLAIYEPHQNQFLQVIPATNRDSFLNLIERTTENTTSNPKRIWKEQFPSYPKEDQYDIFVLTNNHWQSISSAGKMSSFFSSDSLNSWIKSSYVRIYLVILILIFIFIDIVFSAKAIKI
ncbi:MAG: hypothetical protein ACKOWO_03230 [Sediminibacterium sp.]